MAYIFKAGDQAYSLMKNKWTKLLDNGLSPNCSFPFKGEDCGYFYTNDGKIALYGPAVILPINPYDPTDPNNAPDFRNPFVHEGRIVKYGDQMLDKRTGKIVGSVSYLVVAHNGASMRIFNAGVTHEISIGNPNFTFADSISKKEKTYLWAVPMYERTAMESLVINFIRMTKEEAGKYWKAEMVPGSEEEE